MRRGQRVTDANAHLWTPAELIERADQLRREEHSVKTRSLSRTEETRRIRLLLSERTRLIETPQPC